MSLMSDHRTIEFLWKPAFADKETWQLFSLLRKESGRCWTEMVERHAVIRRRGMQWPGVERWNSWSTGREKALKDVALKRKEAKMAFAVAEKEKKKIAKATGTIYEKPEKKRGRPKGAKSSRKARPSRFLTLGSQSVQLIIQEFTEAVRGTFEKRQRNPGDEDIQYPSRKQKYRDISYTNQSVQIRDGNLLLRNARGVSPLSIRIPTGVIFPGEIVEVRVCFGRVIIICSVPKRVPSMSPVQVAIDVGVNTLFAAGTDTEAVLISGREVKAIVQYRNKQLASITSRIDLKKSNSKRQKKLKSRKYDMLDRCRRKVRDVLHKATRKVADAFPNAEIFIGKPWNDAAKKVGRVQAQQISSACNRKAINQLAYKIGKTTEVNEAYSSRTCPQCLTQNVCRRTYTCKSCGFIAPRDVVGMCNILSIGRCGKMLPGRNVPKNVKFIHPIKYPGTIQVVAEDSRERFSVMADRETHFKCGTTTCA